MKLDTLSELEYSEKAAKRAQWESFEFSVPASGLVVVANTSYGDDEAGEHVHTVNVTDGVPVGCTCKADEYQSGACKHRVAVAINTPVLEAASAKKERTKLLADGGTVVSEAKPPELDAETADADGDSCDCEHFDVGELACAECYIFDGVKEVPER